MRIRYQIGLGLMILAGLFYIARNMVLMLLSGKQMAICPHCGSRYINPSQTPGLWDALYRIFGCLAYRCKVCNYRFYRPKFST